MGIMKNRGYPRNFHQRDGQPRRVNQLLWKGDRKIETFEQPTGRMQTLGEALHARALLVDRTVVGILDQPPPIEYCAGRWTFPDFEVRYSDGRIEAHEIKDERLKDDPKLAARTKAVTRAYKKLGKKYRVIFSDECYEEKKRHNVQLIIRSRNYEGASGFLPKAKEFVLKRKQTTLGELKNATGIDLHCFLSLVCDGHFEIELSKDITDDTIVRL